MNAHEREALSGDDNCPVNLRYAEPFSAAIDVDAMIRAGRRLRRKRAAGAIGGSVAVVGVVVGGALGFAHVQHRSTPIAVAGLAQNPKFQSFPPVAEISTLGTYPDAKPQNWSAVAWLSRNGDLCYGAADLTVGSAELAVSCGTAPIQLLAPGADALLSKPVFQPAPTKPGFVLAIGFVHGSANTVQVTDLGTTVTAVVVPVSSANGQHVGAYAVWLPVASNHGASWSDITEVEAFGQDGNRLAQLP